MIRQPNFDNCRSHVRHATPEAAQKEVCRMFEKIGRRLVVFPIGAPCKHCGGYHVGHLRSETKRSEIAAQGQVQKI